MRNIKELCTICKGSKRLCGRPQCPILLRIKSMQNISSQISSKTELFGSSPPGVLVGEWNYPKVNIGGLIPPELGEKAAFYDNPQDWIKEGVSLTEIIRLRTSLIYSRFNTDIRAPRFRNNRFLENTQELALSAKPTDVEVTFLKKPRFRLTFDGIITPVGAVAPVKEFKVVDNPSVSRKVDYLVEDTDVKAKVAMFELYKANIPVYQIFRLLSVGLLGTWPQRKLVPTRWAITAVDKTIGDILLDKVRHYQELGEILLFSHEYLGNHFEILFLPRAYSFEMIEIWMPRSVWVSGSKPSIIVNWELHDGKAQKMDGGYYAIRLPVLEFMSRIKRQGTVIAIREIQPDYFAPVGNWQIRENVRKALSGKPLKFSSLEYALKFIQRRLKTASSYWLPRSFIIKNFKLQKTILEFL